MFRFVQTAHAGVRTIGDMKTLGRESTAKRLASLEQQFIEIAKITKGLRRYLDEVAETVRIAVDELRQDRISKQRAATVRSRARRPAAATPYQPAVNLTAQNHHQAHS
jgi:hypothetical protein